MMRLEFAHISFPAQIGFVDEGNGLIILIWWLMLNMCIESILWSSLLCFRFAACGFCLFIELDICFFDWGWDYFILWCDYSDFHGIWLGLYWYCFLHIIMSVLFTIEADNFVFGHRVNVFWNSWNSLDKTNHGLITLGIKLSIVTSLDTFELIRPVFYWVCWSILLDGVFEVCKESKSIINFNFEWLIIDSGPCPWDVAIITLDSIFAEYCFDLVFVHQFHLPDVFTLEFEIMILPNALKSIITR